MMTYIIKTKSGEFYCGKTTDMEKRMNQHLSEKNPHWFAFKNRKEFTLIFSIMGNFESKIKKFGIKHFIDVYIRGGNPNLIFGLTPKGLGDKNEKN